MIRRNGMKRIVAMVFAVMVITILTVPVFATSKTCEVTMLEDFVFQIENPSEKEMRLFISIDFLDENGNSIYQKNLTQQLQQFDKIEINSKNYFNSERTSQISVDFTERTQVEYAFTMGYAIVMIIAIIALVVMKFLFR